MISIIYGQQQKKFNIPIKSITYNAHILVTLTVVYKLVVHMYLIYCSLQICGLISFSEKIYTITQALILVSNIILYIFFFFFHFLDAL